MPKLLLLVLLSIASLWAQRGEYALVLDSPPLAAQVRSRKDLRSAAAQNRLETIRAAQQSLRQVLAERGLRITGASQTLVNAVFVEANREQAQSLRALPGVHRVEYLPPLRRHLDRAVELVGAPAAWNAVGGAENAGAGVNIAILDGGIDQNHPAFQQECQRPSPMPSQPEEWKAYTNGKVIVARSYVAQLPFADVRPEDSRPDDTSPRDRSGHGTAVAMIAAGNRVTGPSGTIQGMAPKACLGNYKIFGSPGVNDTTRTPVVIQALEDALLDGMQIATLPIGSPAVYGPRETSCGSSGREDCDVRAQAVEAAVGAGLAVVVSAGNDGDIGLEFPARNSIHTPGTAPSAITVGASTNSHVFFAGVMVDGRRMNALFGDGPRPPSSLGAPLRDVSKLQNDGLACDPLPAGSLSGAFGLVQRGECAFAIKVNNAQKAGAAGVVIYQSEGFDYPFSPLGLTETGIPAAMIGYQDGLDLKQILDSAPDKMVTLDPVLQPANADFDTVADFSSRGPSIGETAIKPELVAVGTDLYTATQTYDPNGALYDPSGYTAAQGTSFAAPMVAGAAAIVKQRNPSFTPAQLKSAVVNTATPLQGESITDQGAGKLNAGAAAAATLTVEPAVLSLGEITTGSISTSRALRLTNSQNATFTTFPVRVRQTTPDAALQLSVPNTVSVPRGGRADLTVTIQGRVPQPGIYEGEILIGDQGQIRVPYMYAVGDGVAFNVFPVQGDGFVGTPNEQEWLMAFKVVDRYGMPVRNAPVQFTVPPGGAIYQADANTDVLGIAAADVDLGSELGQQQFTGKVIGTDLVVEFNGFTRMRPTITSNGVVNAASYRVGNGLAPGSYIAIFGAGLSDSSRVFNTPYLPLSLAGVSVSFDATGLSLPGRLHFVSPDQVNVQIPWEFQGRNSVQMKVSVGEIQSAVYNVPLADYSPGIFEFDDVSGLRLAAALDESFRVLTPANPAQKGRFISLYVNGLGPVENRPPSGEITSDASSTTRQLPVVTIAGRQARVAFSGLAPAIVGLYQINVEVPADTPSGTQPVIVNINGIDSQTARIPVQ